jgi:hypothetical protein
MAQDGGIRRTFAGLRIGVGAIAWLAPTLAARLFGIDPERSDRWSTRLFGARELALGIAVLRTEGQAQQATLDAGIAIDSLDAVSGFDELRRGNVSNWTLVSGVLGAIGFAALGVLSKRELNNFE